MNRISKLIRLRKQYDSVKIMLWLFIAGGIMLGFAMWNGVKEYRRLSEPVEYSLSASPEKMTKEALQKLIQTKGINSVSIQKAVHLNIEIAEEGEPIECYQLSADYLRNVYHIKNGSSMKTFYLTPKAYEEVVKKLNAVSRKEQEFQAKYQTDEENGVAKFVLLENTLFSNEKLAFCTGTSLDLSKECSEIRAYITKRDLDGTLERQVEKLGYQLVDKESAQKTEYELKIEFLIIKYHTILGILCISFAGGMWSFIKKNPAD